MAIGVTVKKWASQLFSTLNLKKVKREQFKDFIKNDFAIQGLYLILK